MNRIFGAVFAGLALVAAPLLLHAQEPGSRAEQILLERKKKAENLEPERPKGLEKRLIDIQEKKILENFGQANEGLFPKVGGLQSGQGFALGLQYLKKDLAGGKLWLRSSGVASISKSQKYDLRLTAPSLANGRLELDFLAQHRNLARVDYYGPGPGSSLDDRTSFRLEDLSFTSTAKIRPFRNWLIVGGKVGYSQINTGRGRRPDLPSAEDLFTALETPGLDDQSDFVRTSGFFQIDRRDPTPSGARSGGFYSVELTRYEDVDLQRHDFQRLDVEVQQYFGFFNKRRVIMLRGRGSMAAGRRGQSVPFYLQPYLGGPQELRGFQNYRFYDDNAMVLNVEYRWEAFSGLDMALFVDAGKVAARRADLDLSDLETDVGFGFRFNGRNVTFLRLDVAFSNEGARVWFRFGSPF